MAPLISTMNSVPKFPKSASALAPSSVVALNTRDTDDLHRRAEFAVAVAAAAAGLDNAVVSTATSGCRGMTRGPAAKHDTDVGIAAASAVHRALMRTVPSVEATAPAGYACIARHRFCWPGCRKRGSAKNSRC